MKMIKRDIEENIRKCLFKGKVVIVYGARQVGKTTLVKKILAEYGNKGRYFNCEHISVQRALRNIEPEPIRAFFGNARCIVLDEAQKISHIGLILKVLVDEYPDMQIIATGSSSFELADKVSEPLTGRHFTFMLLPLSLHEIATGRGTSEIESKMENLLRFGIYPEVFSISSEQEKKDMLDEIVSDYLYKDVLSFERIKKSDMLKNLLELLALQLGQEVSYQELGKQLGINRITVQKYIDILEKSFVLFRLRAFSRNKRKEISKSVKIYFYDLGVRNGIIQNYNPPRLRNDKGAMWENFCIIERMKMNELRRHRPNIYFWRTYTQKEVDYIEEEGGKIRGYEFKWNDEKKISVPQNFVDRYATSVEKIDRGNYWKFIEI